jgi:uncharacterized protein YdhG (YjbR/CyaY superfamily)
MKMLAYKTVDAYIKACPLAVRPVLEKMRVAIKKAAPEAEEVISYGMPGYKYHGHLVFFAVQKNFCSFYAASKTILKKYQKELREFEIVNTTIHFTAAQPLPSSLVTKIVKDRVKQNEQQAKEPSQERARRERYRMPQFVKEALHAHKLADAYANRPPYQRNDYIGWITQAKRDATKQARLAQMLRELKAGNVYMKMAYVKTKR